MKNLFGVEHFWYRYEFAKSRGMIHWHGLCSRENREPRNLLYQAVMDSLPDSEIALELSNWAKDVFGMTASHLAGIDENGMHRKCLLAPTEGTAPPPPEEYPLINLFTDISQTQKQSIRSYNTCWQCCPTVSHCSKP